MPYYGSSGQFGAGMQNPQFGTWAAQAPTPWAEDWWKQVDPTQAIAGAQGDIVRQMNANFNSAANRLGGMGAAGSRSGGPSTPYAGMLGNAANDASRQMAEIANRYTYDAAQNEANRRTSAWDASQNRELAWQTNQQNNQLTREQLNASVMQDWWNRYYNSALQGGSPEWMSNWQAGGIPQAQQYARSMNPWV